MVKENTTDAPKSGHGTGRGASRRAKLEFTREEYKDVCVEDEVKKSINTTADKDGTLYSCNYIVSTNDKGEATFNTYNKTDILNPRLKGLNLYARVSHPRFKLDKKEIQEKGKGIHKEAFEAFLEIIKCPV